MHSGGYLPSNCDRDDPKYDEEPRRLPEGSAPNPLIRIVPSFEEAEVVTKPWGREIMLSTSPDYTFKRIELKEGFETSLQLHGKKSETIIFLSGSARVVFEDSGGNLAYKDMAPGSIFEVNPPAVHRVVALTDITYVEASTPDPDGKDVVRLRDGHNRKDGRIEDEHRR